MDNEELNKLKKEYLTKGGQITKLEATKLNETLNDNTRLKHWGEVAQTKEARQIEKQLIEDGLTIISTEEEKKLNGL